MENKSKIERLIEQLEKKTLEKQIKWSPTSSQSEYKLSLESGLITIDNWYVESKGVNMAELVIYNSEGVKTHEYRDNESGELYKIIVKLHYIVNESIYKRDETLDNLLNELS